MSNVNPKEPPSRVVSRDSGYRSIPTSPGMQVSLDFKSVCKKKLQENFKYIKFEIIQNTDILLDELRDRFTDTAYYQLKDLDIRLRKTERILKHFIREGEEHCKAFLKSLQSEALQSEFILDTLKSSEDKLVPKILHFDISAKAIHDTAIIIIEELEVEEVVDPLFEYYIITIDHHDQLTAGDKARSKRTEKLLDILFKYSEDAWVPGFVHVLDICKHNRLLAQIAESGDDSQDTIPLFPAYNMNIKVSGLNASTIESRFLGNAEMDKLCREFANLNISNIRSGSILLMVHPISPDLWRESTDTEKQEFLLNFIKKLVETSDIKSLIHDQFDITVEIDEIKNVFGNPIWRAPTNAVYSEEEERLLDNLTYITEKLDVIRLTDYMASNGKITDSERQTLLTKNGQERAKLLLKNIKDDLSKESLNDFIDALKAINQINLAKKLEEKPSCLDCLRRTYQEPDNYKIILDEMDSSIMRRTVDRFKECPNHIMAILTPECGRPRRERANLFMHYVLVNDEILRSFENVLLNTDFVQLKNVKCNDCSPGKSREDSFTSPTHLLEDPQKFQCVFTVKRESDNSLNITMSTHKSQDTHETEKTIEHPLTHSLPSEPFIKETAGHCSVVVAIDFGTTYSGFAFSQRDKKDKIIHKKWHRAGIESPKTPTTILISPDKQFSAFGYEAEEKYQQLSIDNEQTKWHYFTHFKMELHSTETLTRETTLLDAMGNEMAALEIFQMSISYLVQQAKNSMTEVNCKASPDEISWIITVPAIWKDSAKQFMREAAEMASIPQRHLTIALEPEVAGVFFRSVAVERSSDSKIRECQPGCRFMIIDVGGGTTDITVMEADENNKMKQISVASGGNCGGQMVNDYIFEFLNSIFGKDIMECFKMLNTYDFQTLERDIEFSKRSLSRGKKLPLSLPMTLIEIYEKETKQKLEKIMKKDKRFEMKKKGKISINSDITENFIIGVIGQITDCIDKTLQKVDRISLMAAVGGFAECPLLKERLVDKYKSESMNVIIPSDAGLAVLKGAVMYGHDPTCVTMRKCNYTYGTKVFRSFLRGDSKEKRVVEGGVTYCKDAFNKLVQIGDCVGKDETRTTQIQPLKASMQKMAVKFYCSTEENPLYVTDRSCRQVGEIVVDIPPNKRSKDTNIIVSMTFGKTEILIEGKVEQSGEPVSTRMDFLSTPV